MTTDRFFVLTGAPGSGKTTLLRHLQARGVQVVAEPARRILAEQRGIDGDGLPNRDARLFVELMLSRMIDEHRRNEASITPVLFDRGIPDALGYAAIFGFDFPPGRNAVRRYRYNHRVFFAPSWEEIYTTDEERTVSFQGAREFGDALRNVYQQSGYDLIDISCLPIQERVEFILNSLSPY